MVRGREQEGAEYSAAVSRLADSVCSCSECAMRGRQETAVKEQKKKKGEGAEKERTSACVGKMRPKSAPLCRLVCARTRKCEEFPIAVWEPSGTPSLRGKFHPQLLLRCCKSSGWDVRPSYFVHKWVFVSLSLSHHLQ